MDYRENRHFRIVRELCNALIGDPEEYELTRRHVIREVGYDVFRAMQKEAFHRLVTTAAKREQKD